jgi:iron complex outermembrane receptor protein
MRLLFTLLLFSCGLYSQDKFSVNGIVLDEQQKPIFLANVKVLSKGKLMTGTKTNKNGEFSLVLTSGNFTLETSFIGYKASTTSIEVTNKDLVLANIILKPNVSKLTEVLVSGNKSTKASAIDKKEYSPSQLLNAQNASAAELINALPSINMGNDGGNVSFRGDENVAVMINGKMSSLTGQNLSQIPATSIEKIEIISVPNSKYNSEGSAGIINIVLKNANANFNGGYVLGSVGNNNKYNGQVGYNFSRGKLAISSSYNFTYNEFLSCGWSNREYFLNPDAQFV